MTDAAKAVERLVIVMMDAVDKSVAALIPDDDPASDIDWQTMENGDQQLTIRLGSGRVIAGRGGGRLDAVANAFRTAEYARLTRQPEGQ